MFLAKASMLRPIGMTVLLIALSMFGFLAYRNMGVDLLPQVDVPYITIQVVYPGASPEELETSVAKKIEDAVVQVDGIKHITSTCVNNFCQVLLEFELSRDVDVVAVDVREKVDLIKKDLPDDAEPPQIMKYDINAKAVVTVALTGDLPLDDLYDYADNKLSNKLSSLAGVAKVEIIGGEKREVLIKVDREKLAARGLTLAQIIQKVGTENIKIPSGQISARDREISVMFDGEAVEISDLGNIEIGVLQSERVYLRDVATFSFGTERRKSLAYFNGKSAIVIKVTKKGEANAVAVVERIRAAVKSAAQSLPGGMQLQWVRDDGGYVNATVQEGMNSIWQGVALTGIVLLLFLADIRMVFAAFVSIPITIVISLIAFSYFGYTFNIITMSAIGISIGILVANSIVVLENIALAFAENNEKSNSSVKTIVEKATSQVGLAVAASALTNIVVFLPVATMRTLSGKFLVPFAVVVTAATFASLLISFTLTPIIAMVTHNFGKGANSILNKILTPWLLFYKWLERCYTKSLKSTLKHPFLFVLVCSAATIAAFYYITPKVQIDFVPTIDQGEMTVKLEFPADYTLERTSLRATEVAEKLLKINDAAGKPFVRSYTLLAGKTQGVIGQTSEGSYLAEITLMLSQMTERKERIETIMAKMREVCNETSDVIWAVMVPSAVGGSSQTIEYRILGSDLNVLNSVGLKIADEVRHDKASSDVTHSIRPGRPELRIYPNRAVLHDLGVNSNVLGLSLRSSLAGITATTYKKGDRSYDIRIGYEQEDGIEQIESLNFPSQDGKPFLLGNVAKVEEKLQPTQIVRCEKERAVMIYSNNAPGFGLGTTLANQNAITAKYLPTGYTTQIGGIAEKMGETFSEFGLVSIIAIVLAYLLLCAIMESWVQPFIIMFTVPFSYLGMFAAIALTGTTLSMFGLLAGIMLVGVVVNAAILLIDEVNTQRKNGKSRDEAMMTVAEIKFRPILMSCTAALFGMLPMAIGSGLGSELRGSMGIGSVGGIIVSSIVSLYFIPAMYILITRDKKPQTKKA